MKEHLQPWYDAWLAEHRGTNLIYARRQESEEGPRLEQVHFVRDMLGSLFWCDIPYESRPRALPREDCRTTAWVIGEHTSKSVRLPVYLLDRPDLGLEVVLRDNYHDWNVSVVSKKPVDGRELRGFPLDYSSAEERAKFPQGYKPGRFWGYCFFQGFPESYQFGPFTENPRQFSMSVRSKYEVYTLCWLLLRDRRSE